MRYLRYAFLTLLGISLVSVALANREPVTLRLLTDEAGALIGVNSSITLPLFLVIFGGIVVGILIGFVWEWFREHKHRSEASRQRREKERLEREMDQLKENQGKPQDEVLALLER